MKRARYLEVDAIRNLPRSVTDAILVRLPIRDAVRTSILSREWRYKWTTIPQIVFDKKCAPRTSGGPKFDRLHRVNIVDQVLLQHRGSIQKFECLSYLRSCPDIDRWIVFLSNQKIKEFVLHCSEGDHYKVPSCVFSYCYMRYLELADCIIKPPPTFSGLANLTILVLDNITIDNDAFERLVSMCPLKFLVLLNFKDLTHLKFAAPNLVDLDIKGPFKSLQFENTPLLEFLAIDLRPSSGDDDDAEQMEEEDGCNLFKIIGCLHSIKRLRVVGYSLQFLSLGEVPKMLPIAYEHLEDLHLNIDFTKVNEISVVCCLIGSSPHLQDLVIEVGVTAEDMVAPEEIIWEAPDCSLNHLHVVKMANFRGTEIELVFLEFVLANAPVLRTMTIHFSQELDARVSRQLTVLKELIRFPRASVEAEIICSDFY